MSKILIKFIDQPTLELMISSDPIGQLYFNLVQENYKNEKPIFRDQLKYTVDYMIQLASQANKILGWDWPTEDYSIANTTVWHKNIEELVSGGFDKVPSEHDNLIHELHYCLHIIQDVGTLEKRDGWLQLEWYNNNGFDLSREYQFNRSLKFGDVKLQNPWVGHGPLQLFLEKDFTNISQTCKFHNFVKPGINIVIQDFEEFTDTDALISMFLKHDPNFVTKHGIETIVSYIGYPVIGQVTNLNDLQQVVNSTQLELDWIDFE